MTATWAREADMGLVNGSINGKGIYHGYAVCDLCGKQ